MRDTFATTRDFAWQEGYGAFSVSASRVEKTVLYIAHQTEHHATASFGDEFKRFLERYGVEYDPRYVFG